jgi:phosphoribosylformimino-5-aminoimidazole carboxamide ribotide isomerase
MMSGPDIELYRGWKSLLPELRIIASGGLREAADVEALSEAGIEQAVCGRALLEGNFEQEELKKLWSIEG